jgi:hypothetical protein
VLASLKDRLALKSYCRVPEINDGLCGLVSDLFGSSESQGFAALDFLLSETNVPR